MTRRDHDCVQLRSRKHQNSITAAKQVESPSDRALNDETFDIISCASFPFIDLFMALLVKPAYKSSQPNAIFFLIADRRGWNDRFVCSFSRASLIGIDILGLSVCFSSFSLLTDLRVAFMFSY
jgi:hypothetical protein